MRSTRFSCISSTDSVHCKHFEVPIIHTFTPSCEYCLLSDSIKCLIYISTLSTTAMTLALFIFRLMLGLFVVFLLLFSLYLFFICSKNSSSSLCRSSVVSVTQHASAGNKHLAHFHKIFLPHSTCAQEKEMK